MNFLKVFRFMFVVTVSYHTLASAQVPLINPQSIQTLNGWDVDVESHYSGSTAGAKLIACLADTTLPVGAVCDMRGIVAESTQPVSSGTAPIEIGRNNVQNVLWPSCAGPTNTFCGMTLNTTSTLLPTPSTPTATPVVGMGSAPVGNYFMTINYRTGDAVSASSAEFQCNLTGIGECQVPAPATCPQYTSEVQLNVSTSTGTETWQRSGACGTTINFDNALYPHSVSKPTAATPLPAIILHNNKSQMWAEHRGQNGFPFFTTSLTSVSDMIATTDNGNSGISNLFFFNNGGATIESACYDRGVFEGSTRFHFACVGGASGVSYSINGQMNDIVIDDGNFGCGGSNSTPVSISWTPQTDADSEGLGRINFIGGLVNTKSCSTDTANGVTIAGRDGSGSSTWSNSNGGVANINFYGTSFELGNAATNGISITNATNISLFGILGSRNTSGGTAFVNINQTFTPTGQLYNVGAISIIGSPNIFNFTDTVLNNASTDANDSIVATAWKGTYEFGGADYSKTSGAPPGKVVANLPSLYDSSSPITTYSHLGFKQTSAPSASACGTGTATGADNVFKVTGITGTACTVTFGSALSSGICPGAASQLSTLPVGVTSCSTTSVTYNFANGVTTIYGTAY